MNLEFEGNPHCGLDDASNIARVVIRLLKDGANFRVNEKLEIPGTFTTKSVLLDLIMIRATNVSLVNTRISNKYGFIFSQLKKLI